MCWLEEEAKARARRSVQGDGKNLLTERKTMDFTLLELLRAVEGRLFKEKGDCTLKGISTDTRTLQKGDAFFALKGERFDGHDFAFQAGERGAAAIILSRVPEGLKGGSTPLVLVSDTLKALGDAASFYRRKFLAAVVGITGSTGKTTSKEMLAHLLRGKGRVVSPPESFNNFVGVPLTLFGLDRETEYAVLELGTNARGEIKRLAEIARPGFALLTNIGPAHLEGLGDLRGVAHEKGELLKVLGRNGVAVLNGDDPWLREIASFNPGKNYFFGKSGGVHFHAEEVAMKEGETRFILNGELEISLPFRGEHNLYNAMGAMAVAHLFGMGWEEMAERFTLFSFPSMRFEERKVKGVLWIQDAYNANPLSMKAALSELAQRKGRKVAILGNMRELGPRSADYHREVGRQAAFLGIDLLWAVGEGTREYLEGAREAEMPEERLVFSSGIAEAQMRVPRIVQEGDFVLVKASRAVGLDRIVPPEERGV